MATTKIIKNFRPSKVPGFCQCPGFIIENDTPYEIIGSDKEMEFASLGSAAHEVFALFVTYGKEVTPEVMNFYADKWGVATSGFMGLSRKMRIIENKWKENMAKFFTNPVREVKVGYTMPDGTVNEGTPDIYQLMGEFGMMLDVKTGEVDMNYMSQVKNYSLIIYRLNQQLGLNSMYGYVWNPIIESYVGEEFTADDLEEFEVFLMEQLQKVGKEYKSGPFCGYCNNLAFCPHHRRAFLQMEDKVPQITLKQIAEARPIIKAMEKVCKMYNDTEKTLLQKHGTIDLGGGHELFLRKECRKGFDAPRVVQILKDDFGVGTDVIGPELTISKKSIDKIAGLVAPPRMKGKTIKAVHEALVDGEAVKEKFIEKRATRRITSIEEITDGE